MRLCIIAVMFCVLGLSGCKLRVVAPDHVAVVSGDMTFMCLPGETCEINVSDYDFDLSLYAVPKPGYRFLYWSREKDHLCPGFFSNKCHLSTRDIDPSIDSFREVMNSDQVFYLEPIYIRDDTAPGISWETIESP